MIEEMVKDVNEGSVHVKAIVGDEDSTTISRLRTNIGTNIGKISDANNVKKNLWEPSVLSEKTTQNFNFQSYSISQTMF